MKAHDLSRALKQAQRENKALKQLMELRRENMHLRMALGVPGSNGEALKRIIGLVCARFNVDEPALQSEARPEWLVLPRHIVFWLARKLTTITSSQLGALFNRDHGTVLAGVKGIEDRMGDERFKCEVLQLREEIEQALAKEVA